MEMKGNTLLPEPEPGEGRDVTAIKHLTICIADPRSQSRRKDSKVFKFNEFRGKLQENLCLHPGIVQCRSNYYADDDQGEALHWCAASSHFLILLG